MSRRIDREIEAWGRKSAKAQLGLLWDESEQDGVRVMSYWEDSEWGSPYVIYASQSMRGRSRRHAHCFVHFGQPEKDEILLSADREHRPEEPPKALPGAREIRRMLDVAGVKKREELVGLLVALGHRRDEMDIPTFRRFSGHDEREVRYACLGVLSWQPSVGNAELGEWFSGDRDPRVSALADRFSSGRTPRLTRA